MKKAIKILVMNIMLLFLGFYQVNSQVFYSVTTEASGPGQTAPPYAVTEAGGTLPISAFPNTSCRFVKWVETTNNVGTVYTTPVMNVVMNSNRSFIGYFEPIPQYTLTTSVSGQGTISPSSGTYFDGSSVTLTATPAAGYSFTGWSGAVTGTTNPIIITIDANKSITANFASSPMIWQQSGTNVFCNSGNVGIGTLNPVSDLSLGSGIFNRIAVYEMTTTMPGKGFVGIAGIAISEGAAGYGLGLYGGTGLNLPTASNMHVFIKNNGNVGIGCTNPLVKLAVAGKIQATEVEIKNTPCSDYVFENNYKLMSLYELENFVKTNKHLPDVKSAEEFKEGESYNLGEMDNLLLQKVEELTLYVIELKKENDALKARLDKQDQ